MQGGILLPELPRRFAWIIAMAAILCMNMRAQSTAAPESSAVEANPGRPTVSTPATLTPVGYFQFETGVLGAEKSGEFSNRTGIEEVVKLSVARRLELLVQTEPMVFSDLGDRTDSRPGEVF